MNFKIDLYRDFLEMLKSTLDFYGCNYGTDICYSYIDFMYNRKVESNPRIVKKSKDFMCPSPHQSYLADIETEIASGSDLSPRLSRRVKDLTKIDDLLNNWNIHHLHLRPEGGLDELLFVIFDNTTAYFLDVKTHQDFENINFLEIIENNFPHLSKKLSGDFTGLFKNFSSSQEIKGFWQSGVSSIHDVNHKIIVGNPIVTKRKKLEILKQCDSWKKELQSIEKNFISMERDLKKILDDNSISDELFFSLDRFPNGDFFVVEEDKKIAFQQIGDGNFAFRKI